MLRDLPGARTSRLGIDLENRGDLDGDVEGQGVGSHREARVAPGLAEDVDHQVGSRIDHGRLLREVVRSVDEALELYAAQYALEVAATGCAQLGEYAETDEVGRRLSLLDREVAAQFAAVNFASFSVTLIVAIFLILSWCGEVLSAVFGFRNFLRGHLVR